MPSSHAILGPSSAERWIPCTASIELIASLPQPEERPNIYADEGTAAHALGEIKVMLHFEILTTQEYGKRYAAWLAEFEQFTQNEEWLADCHSHMDDYVQCIKDEAAIHPGTIVKVEQRLFSGITGVWGTSDTVLVSPEHVGVVDLKYGAGIRVEAAGNPQLRLYCAGALNEYGDLMGETKIARYVVFQPRLDHTDAEETPVEELRDWLDNVVAPAALAATTGEGTVFTPTEKGCRWCPASGQCKAQVEAIFAEPMNDPMLMSPDDLAAALQRVPQIRQWLAALEASALETAYTDGTKIPGWKVVQSGGIRKVHDPENALGALVGVGWDADAVAPRKILGIGALEKMLGKTDFNRLLGTFVSKTSGRPSLVPESDRRHSIDRNSDAVAAFAAFADFSELRPANPDAIAAFAEFSEEDE